MGWFSKHKFFEVVVGLGAFSFGWPKVGEVIFLGVFDLWFALMCSVGCFDLLLDFDFCVGYFWCYGQNIEKKREMLLSVFPFLRYGGQNM